MVIDERTQNRTVKIEFEVVGYKTNVDFGYKTNVDYRVDNLIKALKLFFEQEDMSSDIKVVVTIE